MTCSVPPPRRSQASGNAKLEHMFIALSARGLGLVEPRASAQASRCDHARAMRMPTTAAMTPATRRMQQRQMHQPRHFLSSSLQL
eukprot:422585-Rhodomonas_salina.1